MKMGFYGAGLVRALTVLSALVTACAPAAQGAGGAEMQPTAASSGGNAYADDVMPAATPDPVPQQTTAPGAHLDVIGTVTALGDSTIEVDGVKYGLTAATEVKGSLAVGERAKLEFVINADGSRIVLEAKGAGFFDDSGGSSDY